MSSLTNKQSDKKPLIWFLVAWTIINLMQAYFTDLANDEAYYWTWSQHLDWGFIEHPPMVALFIKLGYALIPNEVGVRLMAILCSSLVLYLVYVKLVKKDIWLYIGMVSSILLFHVGGFLTAPDTPLFLFVALYYLILKQYMQRDDWKVVLGMILVITAMMYSKYHGVMVLFFTIIFNLRLLTRKSFWIIAFTSALLYLPHLYWLFTTGKPGLEYATSGRFSDPFSFYQVVGNFLAGQLAIAGPIIGVIVLYTAFRQKPKDSYNRTLKYVMMGILGYFFMWSFKGRTEANWTASAFIPMLVLSHQYISERVKLRKVMLWLAVPSLAFLLLARVQLMFNIIELPNKVDRHGEFHGWKEYAARVNEAAQGRLVVSDGYGVPSKLWFYTGHIAISDGLRKHPNQYRLWNYEKDYLDKEAMVINDFLLGPTQPIQNTLKETRYTYYKQFRSYREVSITPVMPEMPYKKGENITADLTIKPPQHWAILGKENTPNPVYLSVTLQANGKSVMWNDAHQFIMEDIETETSIPFQLHMPDTTGEFQVTFSLVADDIMFWKDTEPVTIIVID